LKHQKVVAFEIISDTPYPDADVADLILKGELKPLLPSDRRLLGQTPWRQLRD